MLARTPFRSLSVLALLAAPAVAPVPAAAQAVAAAPAAPATAFCESTSRAASAALRPVLYQIAFPNAAHHEARVRATWPALPSRQPLTVRMGRSSPGG